MQMHIYSQWLTPAVNNVEFISLKPWAWHSRGCDPTHKRFAIIVSGNVNPPKGSSACWCSSTGSTSRRSAVTVKVIESSSQAHHRDTESNLVSDPRRSLSLSTSFCCELNCLAGGHWCHLGNSGTFELLLVLLDYEALRSWISRRSILINSHWNPVEFLRVFSQGHNKSCSFKTQTCWHPRARRSSRRVLLIWAVVVYESTPEMSAFTLLQRHWISLGSVRCTPEMYFFILVTSEVDIDLDVWPELSEERKWTDGHPRKQEGLKTNACTLQWKNTGIDKLVRELQLIVHIYAPLRHQRGADESRAAAVCCESKIICSILSEHLLPYRAALMWAIIPEHKVLEV